MKNFLLERVDPHNIYRVCIFMPLPVRNVNIYFTPDPVPTLVDAPPRGNYYLGALDAALREIGYRIEEVERILVSHPHVDHFGCVAAIQEKGHCEVWIYQGGAKALTSYEREWADTKEFLGKLLVDGGVPASLISPAARFFDDLESLGCETSVDHYLDGDEVIDLASRSFRVLCVPGHTPWCTIFCDERKEIAFSGDFLLKDIISNPVVQRPNAVPECYMGLKTTRHPLRLSWQWRSSAYCLVTAI